MKDHISCLVPVKYLVEIPLSPAKSPPIADHFENTFVGHLQRNNAIASGSFYNNPMLPMVLVVVNMMKPGPIKRVLILLITIEMIIIRTILNSLVLRSIMVSDDGIHSGDGNCQIFKKAGALVLNEVPTIDYGSLMLHQIRIILFAH